jgi:hypothetical protein
MNSFHNKVHKFLVSSLLFVFVFTVTYVPQPFNEIKEAHALASGSVISDPGNTAVNSVTAGNSGATAASTAVSASANYSLWYKDITLDGILWAMAKQILSQMTTSIVNWINSGFEGSPAFVQDLEGFLLDTADQAFGEYLEEFGGPFSFVCDPFRLDVSIALATAYAPAPWRTLPGSSKATSGVTGGIRGLP